MTHRYSKYLKEFNLIGDLVFLNTGFLINYLITFGSIRTLLNSDFFELQLFFNVAWIISAYFSKNYETSRTFTVENLIKQLLNAFGLYLIFIFAFIGILQNNYYNIFVLQAYTSTSFFLFIYNIGLFLFLKFYRRIGYNYRNVIIVGYGEIALELRNNIGIHPEFGYKFFGYFDNFKEGQQIRGELKDIPEFAKQHSIDEIYCCLPYIDPSMVHEIIRFSEDNFIKVKIIPDFRGFPYKSVDIRLYDHIPVLLVRPLPLDDQFNRFLKRSFDIVFSLLIMGSLLFWLIPIIGIMIKIDSPGPIFFKQKRHGMENKEFIFYKFRTMRINKDADTKQAIRNDPRITKLGSFLRKTSLDELPQFINVLNGTMSVVGPRPHMLKHTEEFSKIVEKYVTRHAVKPGITGLAQAKGFRGETNTTLALKNRVRLDQFYIQNWSLFFDFKIIMLTVSAMLKGNDNAY